MEPAVAIALGVAVLGEPRTAVTIACFLLVMAGSWLSTWPRSSAAQHRREPAPGCAI